MRVAFLKNSHIREAMLVRALTAGMSRHRDKLKAVVYDDQPREIDCDVIAFAGVKCREWHSWCLATGKRFMYFDKGYYYPKEKNFSQQAKILNCWRVAIDTNQPLDYLRDARHNLKRWSLIGPRPQRWREPTATGHIIIAGSSPKFHLFHGLPHPTVWAKEVLAEVRQHTDRPIHYRPKPSWWVKSPNEAVPIGEDTEFVPDKTFEERAAGAHAIITFGSNAALIGMLMGVPSIILGNGIIRLISSTDLSEIETPRLAADDDRLQLLANLAHSQATLAEWAEGSTWAFVKKTFLQ